MKLHRASQNRLAADEGRRGAALMLSFLVLIVIVAIAYQIHMVTKTDAKVAHIDITRTQMDQAIESVLLQALEDLAEDARGAQGSEEGAGAGGADPTAPTGDPGMPSDPGGEGGAPGGEGSGGGGGEDNADAVDSQMDGWWTPATTTFGDIELHIFIRDEDSKYNVLNLLQADEELQREARDRIVRILDNCKDGTEYDINTSEAEEMVSAMEDHLTYREGSRLPRTPLLSDDEEEPQRGMPLTFAEFRTLEGIPETAFFEGYDSEGNRVHGIDAFLTIFTSPALGDSTPGSGTPIAADGVTVNLNTASRAVLDGLFDRRDVSGRMWEEVLEYRNEAEEADEDSEEAELEPIFDEFGEETIQKQIFDTLDELEELYEFSSLAETDKDRVRAAVGLTSQVFEIIVTARLPTIQEEDQLLEFDSRREREEYFRSGAFLVRSVRAVYWRSLDEDEITMIPLIRWEVLEFPPLQILDLPEDRL